MHGVQTAEHLIEGVVLHQQQDYMVDRILLCAVVHVTHLRRSKGGLDGFRLRTAVLATPLELAGVANVAQNARRRKSLAAGPASLQNREVGAGKLQSRRRCFA
jgi:hypothetical protein